MVEKIKSIAILTSGGDSSGMAAAIKSIVNSSIKNGIKPYLVYEGFKGLTEGNIKETSKEQVKDFHLMGRTPIYSARFPEFKEVEVRQKAVDKLNEFGIQALVAIGGDGSYMGAAKLKEMGVKTIGLPGTIDNDIALTDYTIGFFTAQETIVNSIDKIRETMESHNRAAIIEVMGRYCGDLALYSALATGVEVLSIPERKLSEEEIISQVREHRANGKRSIVVLVTEHMYDVDELAKRVEKETNVETRATVLGHTQRAGTPVAQDRINATRMGAFAVERLIQGETGVAVGIENNKLTTNDIYKVVESKNESVVEQIKQYEETK